MKRAILAPDDALPRHDDLVPPWPGRSVLVGGNVIHVRDTPATVPDAPSALYVHGLGGSSQNWTDLARHLAHRVAGQAIDLPGFGHSEPARRYSLPAFTQQVIRWIEHSGRGPVHLLGNSLGGAISVRVAAIRPDLVRSLTLVSPALPFLDPRRSVQGRLLPLLALPRADRLARRRLGQIHPDVLVRMVLEACFADPGRIAPQRLAEATEEASLRYTVPHYAQAYISTMRGLVGSFLRAYLPGSGSLWQLARQVSVPTLVIGGTHDRLVDVRVAPQTARLIPDARLILLPGVGHVAQMEVPRTVARAVVAFLDEVGSGLPSKPDRGGEVSPVAG